MLLSHCVYQNLPISPDFDMCTTVHHHVISNGYELALCVVVNTPLVYTHWPLINANNLLLLEKEGSNSVHDILYSTQKGPKCAALRTLKDVGGN